MEMSKRNFINYVVEYGANKEKTIEAFKIAANNPELAVGFLSTTKLDGNEYEITLKGDPIMLERYRCSPDHMGYAYKCLDTGLPWFTGNNHLTYGSWDCREALKAIGVRY